MQLKPRLTKRTGLLTATLVALYGVAAGEVYKYEGADGNVVFTDEPPADVESEIVEIPSYGPPSTPTPIGRVGHAPDKNQHVDELEQQRIDGLVQEQVSAHERRCTEARVALEVLHQGMPVYWVRDGEYRAAWYGDTYEGTRGYLSEKQRENAIDGQLRKLALNCTEPFDEEQQEKAAIDWLKAEKCMAARKDLELYLEPKSRAPDGFLDRKREVVDRYCGD